MIPDLTTPKHTLLLEICLGMELQMENVLEYNYIEKHFMYTQAGNKNQPR
jgi:hypothetical protein